jgi:hypothetical protein
MRSVQKPKHSGRETLELCAQNLRDAVFKGRVVSVSGDVETAELDYNARAASATLHTIPRKTDVAGKVTGKEMVRLYTGVLSRKSSKARHIYNELRMGPASGLCPLCSQRPVSTLDHYLEKEHHPVFAVTPINLVPACAECNKVRSEAPRSATSDQTLHPYFDNVDDEIWLHAKVNHTDPVTVTFAADPPNSWTEQKQGRVRSHFQVLGLGTLYAVHGAVELAGIRGSLKTVADAEGFAGVQRHLAREASSREASARNSWQGALYRALCTSHWFCSFGYLRIPEPAI